MDAAQDHPEDAFEILKRSSQRLNLKLREVARKLAGNRRSDPEILKQH